MALSLDIAANTRQAQSQVKDLGKELENVSDSLDDVAKDSAKAGDKLEGTFRDMVREAGKADDAIDKIGGNGSQGMGKLKGATQEVTQEMGQNLGEAVSSIRGDLSDLGQVGQDTLGGLAASLAGAGPAGIAGAAALAAGAVGLGLITAELQAQQEQADKLRERLGSAYQDAAEDGRDYLDVAQLIGDANDLMFNPDRADEYKRIREDAKLLSLDESILIKANAGDLQSQSLVQQEINRHLESTEAHTDSIYGKNKGLTDEASNLRDRWNGIRDASFEQAAAAENSRKVTSEFLLQAVKDAGSASEEIDEFGNKLLTLPDGERVVIDAETGQAHQNLDRFKGDADKIANQVLTSTIKVDVDDRAWRNWTPSVKFATVKPNTGAGSLRWDG